MERLLELGGDKKYLTFDDLNRELPDNVVSPDDIEDVLQKLEGSNIPVADSDERLLEQAAVVVPDDDDESLDEDIELDLSAGALEKTNDPVRLYLREMGVVPLLTREGEGAIANRTERARKRLINAIRAVQKEVREAERESDSYTEKLTRKRIRPDDQKEYKRRISAAKKHLQQIEADHNISPVEIKRSLQAIVIGE